MDQNGPNLKKEDILGSGRSMRGYILTYTTGLKWGTFTEGTFTSLSLWYVPPPAVNNNNNNSRVLERPFSNKP